MPTKRITTGLLKSTLNKLANRSDSDGMVGYEPSVMLKGTAGLFKNVISNIRDLMTQLGKSIAGLKIKALTEEERKTMMADLHFICYIIQIIAEKKEYDDEARGANTYLGKLLNNSDSPSEIYNIPNTSNTPNTNNINDGHLWLHYLRIFEILRILKTQGDIKYEPGTTIRFRRDYWTPIEVFRRTICNKQGMSVYIIKDDVPTIIDEKVMELMEKYNEYLYDCLTNFESSYLSNQTRPNLAVLEVQNFLNYHRSAILDSTTIIENFKKIFDIKIKRNGTEEEKQQNGTEEEKQQLQQYNHHFKMLINSIDAFNNYYNKCKIAYEKCIKFLEASLKEKKEDVVGILKKDKDALAWVNHLLQILKYRIQRGQFNYCDNPNISAVIAIYKKSSKIGDKNRAFQLLYSIDYGETFLQVHPNKQPITGTPSAPPDFDMKYLCP